PVLRVDDRPAHGHRRRVLPRDAQLCRGGRPAHGRRSHRPADPLCVSREMLDDTGAGVRRSRLVLSPSTRSPPMLAVTGLAELAVVVPDLNACEEFYTRLLARPPVEKIAERFVRFDVAGLRFILFKPGIMTRVKAGHCGGAQHFAFRISAADVE